MDSKFLLVASYPESLLKFRGPLIRSLKDSGLEIHVAAPNLFQDPVLKSRLDALGVHSHEIFLKRSGLNPFFDLITIFQTCLY